MTATEAQATRTLPGSRFPLGATVTATGTNFAVASDVADEMLLCLFDEAGTAARARPTDTGPPARTTRPAACAVIRPSSCSTRTHGR